MRLIEQSLRGGVAALMLSWLAWAPSAVAQAQPSSRPPAAAPAADPPPDPATRFLRALSKDYAPPAGVDFRTVTIMSDGVPLHGEVFTPKGAAQAPLPAVVMAHGWGGTAAGFRADAAEIAQAGYYVLVFDYRGWGESGSRLVLTGPEPQALPGEAKPFTAQVKPLREYIDPFEQSDDWLNAIDWIMGEPRVDKARVGLRGSSYSGGHVIRVAALDPRVKAVVSQVGGFDSRPDPASPNYQRYLQGGRDQATRIARGEAGYPAPRAQMVMGLIGSPVGHKMERYAPVEDASKVKAPTLIILTEKEEYNDHEKHGKLAFQRLQGPKRLVMIPNATHYSIYREARPEAIRLAIEWFDQHLKPGPARAAR